MVSRVEHPCLQCLHPDFLRSIVCSYRSGSIACLIFFLVMSFTHLHSYRRSDQMQTWSSPILQVAHSSTTSTCRLTITASCPMDLQYFPMDRQLCFIEIESCKYLSPCTRSSQEIKYPSPYSWLYYE